MKEIIEIPEEVNAKMDGFNLEIESGGDKVVKKFNSDRVEVTVSDGSIKVESIKNGKKSNAVVGTYRSHIKNMLEGVQEGYTYKLKTVYAHFPMNVKVSGNKVVIQNFIGERAPRNVKIPEGVSVNVDDDEVTVEGADKEKVSQTAANIEQECHKGSRDPRVFQDGIYVVKNGGAS